MLPPKELRLILGKPHVGLTLTHCAHSSTPIHITEGDYGVISTPAGTGAEGKQTARGSRIQPHGAAGARPWALLGPAAHL